MRISKLRIRNVRNHSDTEISLSDGINIFYGLNGAGKTTILESIAICSFSKSFLPVSDSSLIMTGQNNYFVSAEAVNDLGIPYKVSAQFETGAGKKISSSFADNVRAKDLIGEMPMVILSPDLKIITSGPPESRRNFIDRVLSQASKIYKSELYQYKRALKQRNNLLGKFKHANNYDKSQLQPWTDRMIFSGAEIISRRMAFVKEFRVLFIDFYKSVSSGKEKTGLEYQPYGFGSMKDDEIETGTIVKLLTGIYSKYKNDELLRGISLFGPHKDDLKIYMNGGLAKDFASQGQHKSLLISIKMAEFNFLNEKRQEIPIVLLDDFFSELDDERMKIIFDLVKKNSAQTIITITNPDNLKRSIGERNGSRFFKIENGKLVGEVE